MKHLVCTQPLKIILKSYSGNIMPSRANGAMTVAQMENVTELVDSGAKPSAILSTLTKKEIRRCKGLGIKAKKRPEGGLQGGCYRLPYGRLLHSLVVCLVGSGTYSHPAEDSCPHHEEQRVGQVEVGVPRRPPQLCAAAAAAVPYHEPSARVQPHRGGHCRGIP